MAKRSDIDRLAQFIDAALVRAPQGRQDADPALAPLLGIAEDLRDLPREGFKAKLRADLERSISMASTFEPVTAVETIDATQQTATPRLRIRDAAAAIEFYKRAFGARELKRIPSHGPITYAEIAIGNSAIMLGEEAPEYGYLSPLALGGSPVFMYLYVGEADTFFKRAVDAGARMVSPMQDRFYGDRSGQVEDPFGHRWVICTRTEDLSADQIGLRVEQMNRSRAAKGIDSRIVPEGFHIVTPYLVAEDADVLIQFTRQVFGAEETMRSVGSAGGIHANVRIGDSMLMIGGGGPGLSWRGKSRPMAFHVYVEDTDAAYQRALKSGAAPIEGPADQPYGERSGSVTDRFGNRWYIATAKGESYVPEGLQTVNPYLHPLRADPLIVFLKRGLGAEEIARYASPDGVIHHAKVRIGDTVVEMGEAHGPYQPMSTMFYVFVPDADATYLRALGAGASSVKEPADQPYGERTAAVNDAFGNQWYFATQLRDRE